jgi:hypothetical protein
MYVYSHRYRHTQTQFRVRRLELLAGLEMSGNDFKIAAERLLQRLRMP